MKFPWTKVKTPGTDIPKKTELFPAPKNPNYAAVVTTIRNLVPLAGCDNVVGTTLFGMSVIVGKDTAIGDRGLFFPAETQLSEEFCRMNNLHRHADRNEDPTKKGFFEDSRRVKAVKFRKHPSSAFFIPLSSLSYLGMPLTEFAENLAFDHVGDRKICEKYVVRFNGRAKGPANLPKRPSRVDAIHLPEHVDSENWMRNEFRIDRDLQISVTAKIHGTSIRAGHTYVARRLPLFERIAKRLGVKVQEFDYAYVFGSRKVIKDPNNPDQKHYYDAVDGLDLWNTEGKKLEGLLPKNVLVYGELVGWTGEKPIQVGYTYGFEKGKCGLFVYRVAIVNPDGVTFDLSYDQMVEFCKERGLNHVVEVWRGRKSDFDHTQFMDRRFKETGLTQCLPLSDEGTVDEGVVIRVEGVKPQFFKAKAEKFFEWETAQMDKGEADLESLQSVEEIADDHLTSAA